jgi:hypothetical protein
LAIVEGETIIGATCHIKAASTSGPRYDPDQKAADRHGYDNLILLCRNHHAVIDDDLESYTVERLIKMKTDHEERASSMSDEQVDRGFSLLINQSVTALSQSGGITAHTVNIYGPPPEQKAVSAVAKLTRGFTGAEPKDGQARFRLPDQALGLHWNTFPVPERVDREIALSIGSAMWLRLMPKVAPGKNWSVTELLDCAHRGGNISLQPFIWDDLRYLRAEDGFGTYSFSRYRDSSTTSVAFAFESGEVWSVDTSLFIDSYKQLHFLAIARFFTARLQNYGVFLKNLGLEPPFDWIAGLEGVKGWRLQVPPPPNHVSIFPGNSCLTEIVSAHGTYDLTRTPVATLRPFF